MSATGELVDGALSWLDAHLGHFDPFDSGGELRGAAEVPLSELALLCLAVRRWTPDRWAPLVARWTDFLADVAGRPEFAERPFRQTESLVPHLVVAAALDAAGVRSSTGWRRCVERLLVASTLTAPALPPHRLMELRHATDLARLDHPLPSYRDLYRRTLLSRTLNPVYMSRPEAYLVTHVVFYLTDLGHRRGHVLGPDERRRIGRLVDQLTGMYIIAGNWDLTAELILTSRCLDRPNPFADPGWRYLREAQLRDGAMPGSRWDGDPDSAPAFDTCYHTTLVTALSWIVCRAAA